MNETTRDIIIEDNWCSELMSFGNTQPASENIRAVEPSVLLAIDRNGFKEMMQTVPQFDKVYKQIPEASYANSVYRIATRAFPGAMWHELNKVQMNADPVRRKRAGNG